jgi:hypothetical protein
MQRSASSPAQRDADLQALSDMKAFEGVFGSKGVRLVGRLRENSSREKVNVAFNEGDMKALRAAIRGAQFGSRLEKDPLVQRASAVVSKYDKCLIECRDGMAAQDMVRVQLAFDHLDEIAAQGLGPCMMENPLIVDARAALTKWAPYRPYLLKLKSMLIAGPRPYAQYWLALVEGTMLSPELEANATSDLALFAQDGVQALEEALSMQEVRFHYDVPWHQKNALPLQVRGSLARLDIDITDLKIRAVRERDTAGWPEDDVPASVVVTGPSLVLDAILEMAESHPGEPLVVNHEAKLDSGKQRIQRAAAHRRRLEAARLSLEDAQAAAALNNAGDSVRSVLKARRSNQRHMLPTRGPWYGTKMFTKTM